MCYKIKNGKGCKTREKIEKVFLVKIHNGRRDWTTKCIYT